MCKIMGWLHVQFWWVVGWAGFKKSPPKPVYVAVGVANPRYGMKNLATEHESMSRKMKRTFMGYVQIKSPPGTKTWTWRGPKPKAPKWMKRIHKERTFLFMSAKPWPKWNSPKVKKVTPRFLAKLRKAFEKYTSGE